MKKRIVSVALVVVMAVWLCGCGTTVEKVNKEDNSPMFVLVESTTSWKVVYHKETKVMYVVSNGAYNRGTFTLLINADGTPMLYKPED